MRFPVLTPEDRRYLHAIMHGVVLLGLIVICLWRPTPWPGGDAPRYIILGVNLYEHGVLSDVPYNASVPPRPTLPMGGPLIGPEIALAMGVDSNTRHSLLCFESGQRCDLRIPGLRVLHAIELWVFLVCVWLAARRVLGGVWPAWAAVFVAMLCKEMYEGTNLVLTEPLFLGTLGPFLVAWLSWLDNRESPRHAALLGLALALLCLVKPVFLILLPLPPLAALVLPLLEGRDKRRSWLALGGAGLVYGLVIMVLIGGVMAYNKACCNVAALSEPDLVNTTFTQRIAYDAMSFREWLTGWIYYLPDFGDSWARALFPKDYWFKLGWDDGGYYVYGRDVLWAHVQAAARGGSTTAYLIKTYVLPNFLWHAVVSLLLLWRGIFIGKYWGLVALPFAVWFGCRARASRQASAFLLLAIPLVVVAAVQSAISVSINRYNLGLIMPYSIAFVWGMSRASASIQTAWRQRRAAPQTHRRRRP